MNILLILDSEKKYRQKFNQYESINIDEFIKALEDKGYEVEVTNFLEVQKNIGKIKNRNIVYTANQESHYKKYIEDIIYLLSKDNNMIPRYDSVISQENKGLQELERKYYGLDSLNSVIISDIRELDKSTIKYPIVVKRPNSCSSKGVFLAHNEKELDSIIKKNFLVKNCNYYKLLFKKCVKKVLGNSVIWDQNLINDYNYTRFILQEFVPDLDGDYKILVYGDKYYGLKRGIKEGGFTASGSGIHDFEQEIPKEVLSFAKSVFEKLDIPFAGLDICIDKNKKCSLIEFQSIHIGPVTLIKNKKYYTFESKKWVRHDEMSNLEVEYANAIDRYISKKGLL